MFKLFRKKSKKEILKVPVVTQEELGEILDNIMTLKSYYAGGSLCVDGIIKGDVLLINLSGKCFAFANDGGKFDTTFANSNNKKKIFEIYRNIKGETEYYKEQLAEINK